MALTREQIGALGRKYRALVELRRTQHVHDRSTVRAPLRSLAREFPGALRELDRLAIGELHGRIEQLERAERAAAAEPWMVWMHHYHLTLRAALDVKRRLRSERSPAPEQARQIAQLVAADTGYACDDAFVRDVARPPGGRLNRLVFERLSRRFAADAALLRATLFPDQRPSSR